MKDYVIVANGNFLIKEIIQEAIQDKILIALDGAADKLARLSIQPHIVLGDFDSIDQTQWQTSSSFILREDQQHTDLVKAIHYCDAEKATSITLLCALGGRFDHHENAIRSLRSYYRTDRVMLLHTEQQTLRYTKDETIIIQGQVGDKCGIVAFPCGTFSSQGLQYDVENFRLDVGFSDSIANALKNSTATIKVTGEALIIMPPQLLSQRDFMQKTEVERLTLQLRDAQR